MKNIYKIIFNNFKIINSEVLVLILIPFFIPITASAKLVNQSIELNSKTQFVKDKNRIRSNFNLFDDKLFADNLKEKVEKKDNFSSPNNSTDFKKDSKIFKEKNKFINSKVNDSEVEQNIKWKSNVLQSDSIVEDLKEEINRTIYKTNLEKSNVKLTKSKTRRNIDITPPSGKISVGEFLIPPRGYINLKGPEINLNIVNADALETLKLLAKSGNYGFLYVNNNSTKDEEGDEEGDENKSMPNISANFVNQDYSQVFNSILMASNLQAKFEKGIIFVGNNIFNKSLVPKFSKTYRINQASASSVGDYLSTLGAKISKVYVKSSAIAGDELGSGLVTNADLSETYVNSYGLEGGPLAGLVGSVDLRLQTITLVGEKTLIATAEKYIKSLDVRHRQVALSVQIIDVNLTKSDLTNNRFELVSGATTIFNNGGLAILTGNTNLPMMPDENSAVQSPSSGLALPGNNMFSNWLERKITNDNAKIIASPTLILGENQEPIISGAAQVEDSLGTATIGRPFANEAFIKVGENVITSFEANVSEGGTTTCTAVSGIAGITFGAKLNKIDDNGYVTFSLSPAISSVTKTETVANCGTQSTLSVRRLDTGVIRVRDGNTLIISGVLKDEDTINTVKTPLLGDIPILGRLFRNNTSLKRKSELIILVTPRVLKDADV